jgi:hypothetical protein
MSLKARLEANLKESMKGADRFRVGILRLLLAALHNEEIARRTGSAGELSESDEIAVLKREAKKRREAIEIYAKVGRNDLREQEEKELAVIGEYLPAEMNREDIRRVVEKLAETNKDFPGLMKEAMKELAGRADGKVVAEIVREILGK